MSKEQKDLLMNYLIPFNVEKTELVLWLRDFIWELYPDSNELIYDNYNAVAVGWSPSNKVGHTFCSIAVGRSSKNIHFGFYWGSKLSDPEKILIGSGNQYRYILVTGKDTFPKDQIKLLMDEAWQYSNSLLKEKDNRIGGQTIVMSISEKKRPEKGKKGNIK